MSEQETESIIGNEKLEQPSIDDKIETMETKDSWSEEEHPRDENGKFSESEGVLNNNQDKQKENLKPLSEIMGEEIQGVKGQEAVNKLIEKQVGHVKNAFIREDIGNIALIWGDNARGLCHILERRKQQGINTKDFISNLSDVIEKGQFIKTNDKGRYEIFLNGKMAVIEPEITNGRLTFLLTAFKRRKA